MVHSATRAIMVRSTSPGLEALIVSAHAPHHGHAKAELMQWWSEIKRDIQYRAGDLPVLMMIDANADISLHDAGGKHYHAVQFIRDLCGAIGLRIPTVDDMDVWALDADRSTFGKDGAEYTIDYVFATSDFQIMPGTATAWHDFDTNGFKDHLPTSIQLLPPTAARASGKRRGVVANDRAAAQNPSPEQAQDLAWRLASPPVVPYCIDTTSHQHTLDLWLQDVLTGVFPKKRCPPRAPELSKETVALYDARGRVRAHARRLGKAIAGQTLATIFAHWKQARYTTRTRCTSKATVPTSWSQVHGFASRADRVNAALLHLVAADIDDEAKAGEASDRALDIEKRNDDLVAAIDGNDVTTMYAMTRRITTEWRPRVSPSILDESGRVIHGHVQTKQRWRRHFAGLMEGQATTLEHVILCSRARERDLSINLQLGVVPTNADRARRMRKFKLKSGIGEDMVGTEILKFNASSIANTMAAVTLKTCMQIDAPVQSKGGHIVELYKNKGSRLECSSFRDITLGHVMTKPFAASIRDTAHSAFSSRTLDTQFGALKGRGTDLAHLSMRASYDYAAATSQAMGGIFVDVEKAFARLCRSLVLPAPESDEIFVARLLASGHSKAVIDSILVKARSYDAWAVADGNTHLQALLTEMHTETWASCEYLSEVIALFGGTLAGNALGDLVFTASMAVLLTDLRADLRAEDLLAIYPVEHDVFSGEPHEGNFFHAEMVEASYVDDTFVPVIAPSPNLLPKVIATIECIDRVFHRHGFTTNYSKGKTEAVISAHGHGADALKRKIAHELHFQVPFATADGKTKMLSCVSAYKHLGSRKGSTEAMAAEIRGKCSTITGLVGSLRHKVMANDRIHTNTKANIFQAVLLSRILFNAGTWPILTSAEHTRIHTAVLKHARTIAASEHRRKTLDLNTRGAILLAASTPLAPTTGTAVGTTTTCPHPPDAPPYSGETIEPSIHQHRWLTDQDVYKTTGLCAPYVTILRLRIMLLIRVLLVAPAPLRWALSAAAPAKRSWVRAVRRDLEWLCEHTDEFKHLKGSSFEQVCSSIRRNPRAVRVALTKVSRNAAYSDKRLWATTATLRAIDVQHPCLTCGEVFGTRQALAVHAYRAHAVVRDIRAKIGTHWCAACLQHFGSIERVVCHLREKATRCMAAYLMSMDDLDQEAREQATKAAAAEARSYTAEGRKRHFASAPAIRLAGPLSLHATLAGICHSSLLRDGRRGRSVSEVMDAIQAGLHEHAQP